MFYVDILSSKPKPTQHYTGLTSDLRERLSQHNAGECSHTAKSRARRMETAISFRSKQKAAAFEKYMKTGSGREFARRHF
jgi:putative endonuclease